MSLSTHDEQKIAELFDKKDACRKDSDEYFMYRDAIFSHVLDRLDDYFRVLKHDWNSKFKMSEEDAISIIHDGLLAAVNTFRSGYESKNRVTKFITYLVHILKNNVKNYVTLNYVGAKRAGRKFHKMPLNAYMSLDQLISFSQDTYDSDHTFMDKKCDPILKYLSEKFAYFDAQQNQDFFVEQMMNKLPELDKIILKSIFDGYTLREIEARTNLTQPGLKYRLRRLAQRFSTIEKELCQ